MKSSLAPDAARNLFAELGRGAFAAKVGEAASLNYVLLAVPWPNVDDALSGLPEWNGRVLIDATNPFSEYSPNLVLADLGGKGASEIVAGLAPRARVVKAFNSVVSARFNEGPAKNGGRRVIFVSGDDPEPKEFILGLIKSFGFEPIDLGGLVTGGRLQQAGGPFAKGATSSISLARPSNPNSRLIRARHGPGSFAGPRLRNSLARLHRMSSWRSPL